MSAPLKRLRRKIQEQDEFGLDPRHREFCNEWFTYKDVGRALDKAYGKKGRPKNAAKIFKLPEVQRYIEHLTKEQNERFPHSFEWVVQELLYVVGFRRKHLYDSDGEPLPEWNWPDTVDAAIHSVKRKDFYEGEGEDRHVAGEFVEVKSYSKLEAAAMLLRYFGVETGTGKKQQDRLHEVIAAMREGPVDRKTIEGQGEIK